MIDERPLPVALGDPGPKQSARTFDPDPAMAAFARVSLRMGLGPPVPDFRIEYRPYTGLRNMIRFAGRQIQVRLSDLLQDAPPIVLEALAEILLAKVFYERPSREARECYLAYVFNDSSRRRIEEARRQRGHKRQGPAQGRCFNLQEIFQDLNRRFFHGELSPPRMGWSPKRSRTSLGHYDPAHHSITISRLLDSLQVPRCVVEYLVFHEMLHIKYPTERRGPRRIVHSRNFRAEEKRFPQYEQARLGLKLMSAPLD